MSSLTLLLNEHSIETTMSDYFKSNKAAWEEAFDKRYEGWGSDISEQFEHLDHKEVPLSFILEAQKV